MENAIPNQYQIAPKVTSNFLYVIFSWFPPCLSEHFSSVSSLGLFFFPVLIV